MSIPNTDYTGKRPGPADRWVFEEEIKNLIKTKKLGTLSPEDLLKYIDLKKTDDVQRHKDLIDLIKSMPENQVHILSVIKNVMTMDGRFLAAKAKNKASTVDRTITNIKSTMKNDPSKNAVTVSKVVKTTPKASPLVLVQPIFTIKHDTCNRLKDIDNKNIGKSLMEIRVSTPISTFKGYITTGVLDNKYGIGFFAECSETSDVGSFMLTAHTTTDGLYTTISITRRATETSIGLYNEYIPINIDISPLVGEIHDIHTDILYQEVVSVSGTITTSLGELNPTGCGNLTLSGHGPIDCDYNLFLKSMIISSIYPSYYKGNDGLKCKTDMPFDKPTKSKLLNIRIEPISVGKAPSSVSGSHVLKPSYGNTNFDLYNLIKEIYEFPDIKYHRCTGYILINSIVVHVIGFQLTKSLGRVEFFIAPYVNFKHNMKVNGDMQNGQRTPSIVFETNASKPKTAFNNGFIGDWCNPDSVEMGGDTTRYDHLRNNGEYKLSVVDIIVEIEDVSGLINKVKWNKAFRYSGDFNRYNHDFSKNDYDPYPYPSESRIRDVSNGSIGGVPSLIPEALAVSFVDDGSYMEYVDKIDTIVQYSSNNDVI